MTAGLVAVGRKRRFDRHDVAYFLKIPLKILAPLISFESCLDAESVRITAKLRSLAVLPNGMVLSSRKSYAPF